MTANTVGIPTIIAIGASAGGLPALESLFSRIQPDGNAIWCVLQHFPEDEQSQLADILSKTCSMPLEHVHDRQELCVNHIYIIHEHHKISITANRVYLQKAAPASTQPINTFYGALSEQALHVIAVILSGAGSDGSIGARRLKGKKSIIIAQSPDSAEQSSMPEAIISAGIADKILPPNDIADYLNLILKRGLIEDSLKQDSSMTEELMNALFQKLVEKIGIDFRDYKPTTIARRLERRILLCQQDSFGDYFRHIQNNPKELDLLLSDLLINVSWFFREPDTWKSLSEKVIGTLISKLKEGKSLRLWVPACATGEEAYSLGILLLEALKDDRQYDDHIKIYATDIDPGVIAFAGRGAYSAESAEILGARYLSKYFDLRGGHYIVNQRLRKIVTLAQHNLISDPPFSKIDLLLCRNILIYFKTEVQKNVLNSLLYSLKKGGVLMLGQAEQINDFSDCFTTLSAHLFRKIRSGKKLPTFGQPFLGRFETRSMLPLSSVHQSFQQQVGKETVEIQEFLLKHVMPPCFVLDEEFNLEFLYGETQLYLQQSQLGRFSLLITDLIQNDLRMPVHTALHKARSEQKSIVYNDISFSFQNTRYHLSIQVRHILLSAGLVYFLLIIQPSEQEEVVSDDDIILLEGADSAYDRIDSLSTELRDTRQQLQTSIEELETSNEELQVANETLTATNEELQSTNEELQCVNQEVVTINKDREKYINALTDVNADLHNLMHSTDIGILFLDDKMQIRSATPAATRYIPLIESDIGRPINHFAHRLGYDNLLKQITQVFETKQPRQQEVRVDENFVLIRLMPYIAPEKNAEAGVVITLTDVTELRHTQEALEVNKEELDRSKAQLRATIEDTVLGFSKQAFKILIVDDEADYLLMLQDLLQETELHLQIETASTSEQALAKLDKQAFDLCLLDYYLPDGDAITLLKIAGANKLNIAFIILSGANIENRKELLSHGVFDFLDKSRMTVELLRHSLLSSTRHAKTTQFLALLDSGAEA